MKVIVFLADGFEEVEALTVVDYLRRLDKNLVETVAIGGRREVVGAHEIRVLADKLIDEIDSLEDYMGLVIPGGLPGATNLRDSERVIEIVKEMNEEGKMLGAICAGPIVLARAGVIEGKKITSFPGFEADLSHGEYLEENVVVDGNIISSRGPALAVEFALEIINYLLGGESVVELREDILYEYLFKSK